MRSQVRVLLSPPKNKSHPKGWLLFFARYRTRTHLNADVRWTSAATSSKTGGFFTFCPKGKKAIESCCLHQKETTPYGVVFLFGGNKTQDENPSKCNRVYFIKEDFTSSPTPIHPVSFYISKIVSNVVFNI